MRLIDWTEFIEQFESENFDWKAAFSLLILKLIMKAHIEFYKIYL